MFLLEFTVRKAIEKGLNPVLIDQIFKLVILNMELIRIQIKFPIKKKNLIKRMLNKKNKTKVDMNF